jgi:tetratricopeptide (TPR) repeat protein
MVQEITNRRDWIGAFFAATLLAGPAIAAEERNPDLEARFQAGMEALEEDRLESAIRAFRNILDIEPELHRARLELALAYYRSLRYEEAQRLAQEVLDDPATPADVRVTVRAFLAQVERDAERYGRKSDYSSFIAAGVMHDSNVNVGPTNAGIRVGGVDLVLTPGSTSKSDNAVVLNGGVDHLYQTGNRVELGERTGTLLWLSGGGIYWRRYHEENDYDLLIASLNTGPALLMLRDWRASLQLHSDYLTIGGEALGWFNGVTPSMTWQLDEGELNWEFNYTRRFYHRDVDDGREGDYLDTGVTIGQYLKNRSIAATGGLRAIKFFADDDQFGYWGGELSAGYSADTWENGTFYARARGGAYSYDGKDPLFEKDRTDLELRTTLGLTHEYKQEGDLLENWLVNLFWERTYNNSNIGDLYSYKRYQMMLMLSRSF